MVTRIDWLQSRVARGVSFGVAAWLAVVILCLTPSSQAHEDASTATGLLIAPPTVCYPQRNSRAPVTLQEQAMLCMVNYARERAGLAPVTSNGALAWSADHKAWDIIRCRDLIAVFDYAHYACGRAVTYWVTQSEYGTDWKMAENIAWGPRPEDTVRSLFRAWMASPRHRPNILSPFYVDLGVALRFTRYDGLRKAVWVGHFGYLRS